MEQARRGQDYCIRYETGGRSLGISGRRSNAPTGLWVRDQRHGRSINWATALALEAAVRQRRDVRRAC